MHLYVNLKSILQGKPEKWDVSVINRANMRGLDFITQQSTTIETTV